MTTHAHRHRIALPQALAVGLVVSVVQVVTLMVIGILWRSSAGSWGTGVRLLSAVAFIIVGPMLGLMAVRFAWRLILSAQSFRRIWLGVSGTNLVFLLLSHGLEEAGMSPMVLGALLGFTGFVIATGLLLIPSSGDR